MNKKYVVELARAERERLLKLVSSGTAPARMLNRARVLLKADADGPDRWTDERIARALDTSVATVGRVRKRFCRRGLEAALKRSLPDRVYERSLDGRAEARLIALACSEAPEGRDRWSMRLLADKKAVELASSRSPTRRCARRSKKRAPAAPSEGVGDPAPQERGVRVAHGGRARPLRRAARPALPGGLLRRATLPTVGRRGRAAAGRTGLPRAPRPRVRAKGHGTRADGLRTLGRPAGGRGHRATPRQGVRREW